MYRIIMRHFPCLRLNWLELFPVGARLKAFKFYMKPLLNNISHALGVEQPVNLKYLSVSRLRVHCAVSRGLVSRRREDCTLDSLAQDGHWNAVTYEGSLPGTKPGQDLRSF